MSNEESLAFEPVRVEEFPK